MYYLSLLSLTVFLMAQKVVKVGVPTFPTGPREAASYVPRGRPLVSAEPSSLLQGTLHSGGHTDAWVHPADKSWWWRPARLRRLSLWGWAVGGIPGHPPGRSVLDVMPSVKKELNFPSNPKSPSPESIRPTQRH